VKNLLNECKLEEALQLVNNIEMRENLPTEERLKAQVYKGWIHSRLGDFKISLEIAEELYQKSLELKMPLFSLDALYIQFLIFLTHQKFQDMFRSVKQSEQIFNSLPRKNSPDFQEREAKLFLMKGSVSYLKGKLDLALGYHRKSLALLKQIDPHSYFIPINLFALALDYHRKGELKLAIESHEKALSIIPEGDHYGLMAWKTMISQNMGKIFYQKGDLDTALDYNKRSFDYWQRTSRTFKWMPRLFVNIIEVFLAKKDIEHAHIYLKKLEQLNEKIESREGRSLYQLARALILKNSVRLNDHAEAVNVLKNIVNRASTYVDALKCLCELYFEEFQMTNQMEVLDDIQPLIDQLQKNAINENSYSLLADVKLLQAKMALIQINMVGARKLLTEAQNIADTHDLQLLAGEISREHDRLLEELKLWESFKKEQVSVADRLKLASIKPVMERLQGRRAIEIPDVNIEEPILLIIMDKSGVTYFNHSFIGDWDFEDLFSSFMSAFNAFSGEIFSRSIDRIKIGENTILINPIEPFLACYVIKGQSYPAQQKLTRFSETLKSTEEIWKALNKAVNTSEMLDLNNPSSLGNIVNEIFIS